MFTKPFMAILVMAYYRYYPICLFHNFHILSHVCTTTVQFATFSNMNISRSDLVVIALFFITSIICNVVNPYYPMTVIHWYPYIYIVYMIPYYPIIKSIHIYICISIHIYICSHPEEGRIWEFQKIITNLGIGSRILVYLRQDNYITIIRCYAVKFIHIWATVNIWYIAPSHQFLKSVLSFFRFWYISKCYRLLKSVLSFSKPQLNF